VCIVLVWENLSLARRGEKRQLNRALIDAVLRDDPDGVRTLLQQGADADARDAEHDETVLMLARSNDMQRLLLEHGADVHARDDHGRTAFWWTPTPVLLEAGADINIQNGDGETALMRAIWCADFALVKWLLANGVDVDIKDDDGQTALSLAREYGFLAVIEMLTQAGAKE